MEGSGVIEKSLKRAIAALLSLCLFSFSIAYGAGNKKNDSGERVNYAAAREDILQFEKVLDNAIN